MANTFYDKADRNLLLQAVFLLNYIYIHIYYMNYSLLCNFSWCRSHFSTRSFCFVRRLSNFSLIWWERQKSHHDRIHVLIEEIAWLLGTFMFTCEQTNPPPLMRGCLLLSKSCRGLHIAVWSCCDRLFWLSAPGVVSSSLPELSNPWRVKDEGLLNIDNRKQDIWWMLDERTISGQGDFDVSKW